MKRVIAIIRPVMLDDVVAALHRVEDFPGAVMSEVKGVRRGTHQRANEHREPLTIDFPNYIRIEIICSCEMASNLVEAIRTSAHTGKEGDGKIFTSSVSSAVRIRDGQTDGNAT